MRIVGLIAEYNPFHNGHQYHIEKAKEVTGADAAIAVMSGNFVQRGTPAIMPKHLRTEAALRAGASLIIELPVCYATGSAEMFARGAVSILHQLGCVDAICFGSECGDITVLKELADILQEEPPVYKNALQEGLRRGLSFPSARQEAVRRMYPDAKSFRLLEEPNNILGIEYLKALSYLGSDMTPHTILRKSSYYHDTELREALSSASAIRQEIAEGRIQNLRGQIPDTAIRVLETYNRKQLPIYEDDFSLLLKYKLLHETKRSLTEYADISEELANRIANQLKYFISFKQFCDLLKTKEVTYSHISRALLHILLNVKKETALGIGYARVLGFRTDDTAILSEIKKTSVIPLITKLTDTGQLSDSHKRMLDADIFASDLYGSVLADKFKQSFRNEYEHPIVRI